VTAASVTAGTGVLRHCDLNDPSGTVVEWKSNHSCNERLTGARQQSWPDALPALKPHLIINRYYIWLQCRTASQQPVCIPLINATAMQLAQFSQKLSSLSLLLIGERVALA